MADNATTGTSGQSIAADEVIDGTLGTVKVPYSKIMDGALDGTAKAGVVAIGTTGALRQAGAAFPLVTGTITTATSVVTTPDISLAGNITVYVYGTYAGVNLTFEISPDGTNWFPVGMSREDSGLSEIVSGVLAANTLRSWTTGAPGLAFFRVRATAWTSGTANIAIMAGTYPFEPMVSVGSAGLRASDLVVSATAASGTGVTATLPAAGAGLFHYINRVNIVKYAAAALSGTNTPTNVTTTNLPGTLAFTTPTALAIGTQYENDVEPSGPIKSSAANTATTFVAPATTNVIWRINVYYYAAP